MLSRVTGFGRVFALAYAIGSTGSLTRTTSPTTPNIVYELVLGGVLSATLVPVFVERLETDEDPWPAVSAVVTVALVLATAVSVVLFAIAPLVIRLYTLFNTTASAQAETAVATNLLRWFAPQVAFYSAITITTALLIAKRRFANPKFSPIANNLVSLACCWPSRMWSATSASTQCVTTAAPLRCSDGHDCRSRGTDVIQLPGLRRGALGLEPAPRDRAARTAAVLLDLRCCRRQPGGSLRGAGAGQQARRRSVGVPRRVHLLHAPPRRHRRLGHGLVAARAVGELDARRARGIPQSHDERPDDDCHHRHPRRRRLRGAGPPHRATHARVRGHARVVRATHGRRAGHVRHWPAGFQRLPAPHARVPGHADTRSMFLLYVVQTRSTSFSPSPSIP